MLLRIYDNENFDNAAVPLSEFEYIEIEHALSGYVLVGQRPNNRPRMLSQFFESEELAVCELNRLIDKSQR